MGPGLVSLSPVCKDGADVPISSAISLASLAPESTPAASDKSRSRATLPTTGTQRHQPHFVPPTGSTDPPLCAPDIETAATPVGTVGNRKNRIPKEKPIT